MRTLRIRVTAEHIEAADALGVNDLSRPVTDAIADATGETVDVSGSEPYGTFVASIGGDGGVCVLVVDLPEGANAWLNARWDREVVEPFEFDLEVIPDWLERALGPEQWLTLREAADKLGVTPTTLRQLADREAGGVGSPTARRLRAVKVGRDWLVPESGLAAEIAHRLQRLPRGIPQGAMP